MSDPIKAALDLRERAIQEIISERERQIKTEGWAPSHDDQHDTGEIARAAASYAMHAGWAQHPRGQAWHHSPPSLWPWGSAWWKPKDIRRDLIRAAALLLAEIERIDRRAAVQRAGGGDAA